MSTHGYINVGAEADIFTSATRCGRAVMLKGPTGCGKTRFVESMAESLERPLITVSCHEDLTASDLIGRFHLSGGNTIWQDGPLTRAMRTGAICYLDEVIEARTDTTVVIHALTDHRRELFIDRLDETLKAPPEFMLVVSYNPGYQNILKTLKPSTRQRMVAIELGFPPPAIEVQVLQQESGTSPTLAEDIVKLATAIRALDLPQLDEACSTRTLLAAADLMQQGLPVKVAARAAIVDPLSDDAGVARSIMELVEAYLG